MSNRPRRHAVPRGSPHIPGLPTLAPGVTVTPTTVPSNMDFPRPSTSNNTITTAATTSGVRKRRHLQITPVRVLAGVPTANGGQYQVKEDTTDHRDPALVCPICFEYLREPHITQCGHTFCYPCISSALAMSNNRCPKCSQLLEGVKSFPNLAVNEVVNNAKKRAKLIEEGKMKGVRDKLREFIYDSDSSNLTADELDFMITSLNKKRELAHAKSNMTQQVLVKEFLTHLKGQKNSQLYQMTKEIEVIDKDLQRVEENIKQYKLEAASNESSDHNKQRVRNVPEGFNVKSGDTENKTLENESMAEKIIRDRKHRMHTHFDDLLDCYFQERARELHFPSQVNEDGGDEFDFQGLKSFTRCLNQFTRYSAVRPLSTLNYTTDMFNSASIVSSIEFDKDSELFGIAGVTKRIKIYDFNVCLKDTVDIHYPSAELVCNSKISCISWSPFQKYILASSNYEGAVILWDVGADKKIKTLQEHEKRCWSVDFNLVNTKLLASGSDDSRVKLWTTDAAHSVCSLEAKANVCCVKFNPTSAYHLAFGSADHCVHYYDLRNTKKPLSLFAGHKKAVSYVKFLDSESLVSASTDSQLKMWKVGDPNCQRTYHGHVNEKNFVGLATDGDFITCGSENNSLYVYYKGLSKPLFTYKFEPVKSVFDRTGPDSVRKDDQSDVHEFVSAVCWRNDGNIIVGANSQGVIKVLEMV